MGGIPHNHGYSVAGTETRTVRVEYAKDGTLGVTAGIKDLQVLKTTESGYVGFHKVGRIWPSRGFGLPERIFLHAATPLGLS